MQFILYERSLVTGVGGAPPRWTAWHAVWRGTRFRDGTAIARRRAAANNRYLRVRMQWRMHYSGYIYLQRPRRG
eukprot:1197654-Karenia_brevis.AAC.2